MRTVREVVTTAAIAGLLTAFVAVPSDAAPRGGAFDGMWSVSIHTQYGPCDPTYRYPARIVGGRVLQADNDFSYQLSGAVGANGGISVVVSKSGQSAVGSGRLTGSRGGGTWRTSGGQCAGSWSAARRG
jgi:hypothetical protein